MIDAWNVGTCEHLHCPLGPRYDRRKGGKRGRPVSERASERGRPDGDAERFAAVELEREVDEPCRAHRKPALREAKAVVALA